MVLKVSSSYCDISSAVQLPENGQKGRDEKEVACCTQAKQWQGRSTPSPWRCAYQHTNKGSTWLSSAFPASWLWWSENCDLQLATWRHICGFPVVLIIKENNAQLERLDVWKDSQFVRSFHLRTEDYQSILECWSCFSKDKIVSPTSPICLYFDSLTDLLTVRP